MPFSDMVDWKTSFRLFANVAGLAALGALTGLALAALRGSFTIDYGYLPLLGALISGAVAVCARIGIGGLRKRPLRRLACHAASRVCGLLVLSRRGLVPRPVRREVIRRLWLSTRDTHMAFCCRILRIGHLCAPSDPQVSLMPEALPFSK